ncbi:GNAT family N-acetyltransferase [Trueperella pecoris]|uniref:GNAT family N-acetyltransferase n=1 Tax=Trueperella pecoris TaxID=2733571 RepID=A0A7M1R4Y5_9ACTO|nr:GNAT family N-acetyltransferase [Trueperella pecoris]QOR48525.1 GNAT family N-acetyltransferase [Trueperella pecoris]
MHTGKITGRTLEQRLAAPRELAYPSPHLGLSWSQLKSEDLDELGELLHLSADPEIYGELRISQQVTPWSRAPESERGNLDAIVGRDAAGALQAIGLVFINPHPLTEAQANIYGAISPHWRGRGIGRALLEWQDGRARQLMLAAGYDLPVSIRSRVKLTNMERRRLLAAGGFSPQNRWTYMDVRLGEEHREHSRAARERLASRGMEVIPFDSNHSEEVLRLHNRISMVMDRRQPLSAEEWEEQLTGADREASVLLTDGSNLVGYSLNSILHDRQMRVTFYGIDRGFRHSGNGTNLILAQMEPALDAGIVSMSVPVVSEFTPPTEFLTKYGFFEGSSQILYSIDI